MREKLMKDDDEGESIVALQLNWPASDCCARLSKSSAQAA